MDRHTADSSGGEMKRERERSENGVTNHHTTTKMRRNNSDPQLHPSIEIGCGGRGRGGDGMKLDRSRKEKRSISVVPL